jgi:hypothetical protein
VGDRFLARLIDFVVVIIAPVVVLATIVPDSPESAGVAGA